MAARARVVREHNPQGSQTVLTSDVRPLCRAVALMLAAGFTAHAHAAGIVNLGQATVRNAAGGVGGAGGSGAGVPNLGVSAQQALQASQPSIRNLGHAAQAIAAQIAAQQSAAAAAAATASTVPNGLTPGGLQVAAGVSSDPNNALLWYNANAPTQTVDSSGHVNVDVKQTGQNAVLTWQTMNVGRQTTLNFDQSSGTQTNGANNWAVLNRIEDPSGRPSQILGNITAQGSVYVINRNGILFGAGSQVNVHSLVASSLNLLDTKDELVQSAAGIVASNKQFLSLSAGTTGGLAYPESGNSTGVQGSTGKPNEILGLGNQVTTGQAYQAPGDVTIAPGASITTHTNGTVTDGGFVIVAAPNVTNGGSITATAGQVVLAAGVGVSVKPNKSGVTANPQILLPELSGQIFTVQNGSTIDITPAGTLTNTGIVQAARGNVNLLGSSVQQNGVVGVTTSVNTPGSITISTIDEFESNDPTGKTYSGGSTPPTGDGVFTGAHRAGFLSFGPDAVTAVMPDNDGQTATSTPGTVFTAGNVSLTSGSVWFQGGSLIEAPGSSVSVNALTQSAVGYATPPGQTAVPGRIYLDSGAIIDVSGLANVELPIAQTLVTIPRLGQNELADSPLLRDGFLFGLKNVVVDSTLTGTRSDGVQWVGSPILNLSGYVNLIPRTVDQLLTNGGTVTLTGNEVMTATGSSINLNGGYVHYDGGMVNTTRLVDANGAIVPIGEANPYDTYLGIAGAFTETHPRWQVTKTWYNPLQSGTGYYEPDFIVGGNAGTLDVYAAQSLVLDGDISAQAFGGSKQTQGNSLPTGGTFNLAVDPKLTTSGQVIALTLNNSAAAPSGETSLVILQNTAPQLNGLVPGFSIDTPITAATLGTTSATDPNNLLATMVLPADTLSAGGFANVNIASDKLNGKGFVVAEGTTLALQPGGSLSFSGTHPGSTTIAGEVSIPSGKVTVSNGGSITVTSTGTIDVAGQWVNNGVQTAPDTTPGNSEFINGGSISLTAGGRLDLQPGSVLDVSGGGEMQANGQLLMNNGIAAGKGGSVSLVTFDNYLAQVPADPYLAMDGTIKSFGFSGGGTLTLGAAGFQVGGDTSAAHPWDVVLPTDFFANQGFGNYVLNALYDSTVAAGATVRLTQQNTVPDAVALQGAASGTNLSSAGLTTVGTLDAYHRQATSLVMTGGGYLPVFDNLFNQGTPVPPVQIPTTDGAVGTVSVGQGASIVADAGASIGLGSPVQVTVLGSLIAPGGSITLSAESKVGALHTVTGQAAPPNGYTSPSQSVWLGPDALLDVSGVALTNPLAAPVKNGQTTVTPNTGKVLPGGSVMIADDSGYIVAQAGSKIDVSGTAASFDQLQANGTYASQPVWSDAGSITLAASSGLMFDGTLKAQPGASQAQGGTLTLLPEGNTASALVLQQSGTFVPAGLAPGQSIVDVAGVLQGGGNGTAAAKGPTGVIQFATDRLTGSGLSTFIVGDSTSPSPVPVAFVGDVGISVSKAVQIYTNQIAALSNSQLGQLQSSTADSSGNYTLPTVASVLGNQSGTASLGSTVTIDAPYVALVGPTLINPAAVPAASALSDATLNVNASFIDLENQVQLNNVGQANFTSSGDIRLSSTSSVNTALQAGQLYTAGNLTFKAADVYPATGNTFILDAVGPAPTTITFESNGTSGVPLSAGGTLLVDATNIVQGGTVRAPSGTLVFGVGDPSNSATKTQFNNLTLVATDSVTFAGGSVTSVSNGNTVIPYGATVDGVEWQFSPVANSTTADVTAPPAKYIGVNGGSIALNKGATIDLSGGGDLQAAEWVPGTGGTRDVLSQYNLSYANSAAGTAVPVNVGATNVYAIVPGAQSPVAAYDPVFAQTLQPSTNGNGTAGTTTTSLGVGQAGTGSAVGQAVYLSGVPGLAAGVYTLLPGKYATLPGAYRVTVSSSAGNVAPGASKVLADGTVVTAGYFADALSGSRSATPTVFNVQSGAVWQQYSQYTLTGANTFFPSLAAGKGNVTPPLPVDGGQLVLAATNALALGATLNTAAGQGGAPAEVDIASQDIQITGNGAAALPGYLQISAADLDSLDAGSLLIGGTRTATTSGITISPIANSVVVSDNGSNALSGPEILLVTKTDATGTDANAANGLRVDAGSAITASGNYPAAKDAPITIAGDGALLRVSNGAMTTVTRTGATGTGNLTVGAGATLTGGAALTLDSSGDLKVDPTAVLSAKAIMADGSAITFTDRTGAAAANLPGFVLDPAGIAQLANADQVILRSAGAISFIGNVNATFGNSVDLSAGTFASDGGNAVLNGQQVAFTNETGATSSTATAGTGTLTVNAKEIDFGTGDKNVSGFGAVTMNATAGIAGQNTGTFDFGALPVTLNAPVYLADTSSAATIKTTGVLSLNNAAGTALTRTPVGGAWSFVGGTVLDNGATIAAPAGNVSLEATSGNLTIGSGSTVSSAGVSKQFFDVTEYAPAGTITLTADAGTVDVQPGATLDFSGAKGGGAAGSLTLSAPQQVVNLNGALKGGAASGFAGGSFSLNTGGAANLDSLAQTLASSGVNSAIAIRTKAGNLTLSPGNTLTAQTVSLTADGGAGNASDTANGNVNILGTINASGKAGGEIDLYGRSGVDVEGALIARGSDANQRGGKVNIDTSAVFDPAAANPYNTTYGYENIDPANAGLIKVGAGALIDVSGGTAGGLSGGTVNFRAPLLVNGTVNVQLPSAFNSGAGIVGSRATTLEAYAVWSTTDATTGAQHFDSVVDPAGWFDSQGHLLAGTFTAQGSNGASFTFTPDSNGDGLGTLTNTSTGAQYQLTDAGQLYTGVKSDTFTGFGGLDSMYFAPGTANTTHQTFYGYANGDASAAVPGTLMGFVEQGLNGLANPFAGTSIQNARVVPGIELDNPTPAINGGDILVLTNWNLGAGSSASNLAFRFNGQAPVITFRADNDVKVKASLTDGFFQIANPIAAGGSITVLPIDQYGTYAAAKYQYNAAGGSFQGTGAAGSGLAYYAISGFVSGPADITAADPQALQEYYALYSAYAKFLDQTLPANVASPFNVDPHFSYLQLFYAERNWAVALPAPAAPPLPSTQSGLDSYAVQYVQYLAQYTSYISNLAAKLGPNNLSLGVRLPATPAAVLGITPITASSIPQPVPTDNTPSPTATAANPVPLLSASLAGGSSTSFRLVAGANTASADPLAVQAASVFGNATGGSVTLDAHSEYVDTNGRTLVTPTMIRTGTGSIDVAAGNNVSLFDTNAPAPTPADTNALVIPGAIYTAGAPTSNNSSVGSTVTVVRGGGATQDILVSPTVTPDSAGDITIRAQGNVNGMEYVTDTNGSVTGQAGNNISQFWWQWMEVTANPTADATGAPSTLLRSTSINFGAFDQGVMSVGGNVSVHAGSNVSDLAVSSPTTWYLDQTGTPVTVGGGNLSVSAGGNILSGDYFVAKGTGTITAGGRIGSDFSVNARQSNQAAVAVSTILAAQDGVFNVTARQGADIGAVLDPSYASTFNQPGGSPTASITLLGYKQYADGQGYSATSAVNVLSTTGDVQFGTLGGLLTGAEGTLPASVNLTAFDGGIDVASGGTLYPSAVGQLNLIGNQSVNISNAAALTGAALSANFVMSDADPSQMPSPTQPQAKPGAHAVSPLHASDTEPARIYSLNGSIVDGIVNGVSGTSGFYTQRLLLSVDKPALIQAGQDIVNLAFQGQNLRGSDVTRIVAGRDIFDTPLAANTGQVYPLLVLGGPGTFDVEAGRNIGPLTNPAQVRAANIQGVNLPTGIDAVGNTNNPNLPHESANINVLFGVGPGVALANFVSTYIDPASSVAGVPSTTPALIAFMEQYDAGLGIDTGLQKDQQAAQARVGTLTADEAWKQFQALPSYVQQLFAEQVLFNVLTQVGQDYNNPSSPYAGKYARGYQAINALFPASFGYTANNLEGGSNGANKLASTGDLDIRSTTIQTQQGGNISILGPGGQALVGSTSAPPQITDSQGNVLVGPGMMGILTLEQGNIDIFTDRSVLLAQSRIFTEQGGDLTIWSSNGDINAGKGAKTSADTPAPQYACDPNHYCIVDARGEVTGAGIATLQSVPGAPPGNANLIAPRGTVDAGDAGIRVSGNLNVAALHVANVDNIQVQGTSLGVPVTQAVNTGALTAASSAASAASQMAQDLVKNNASGVGQRRWAISVQVEGFGDAGDDRKRKREQVGYDASSAVSVVGFGPVAPAQRSGLTQEERERLGKI
ncbi:filamentous haemagglutinin family protein [Paraburkholderia sp. SUR17]|uniref:filamentous haemagglutinin family protein n=1 Tax=Paraburkholderia sp. SUR17 TaxID=3034358 RepID=UPI0024077764|nr:filamentous haemagglutinin family protein [Paraburkholderia sp. SUR17]WEY41295.1 filamentous hemagglutinin family protein [Paraburkholderia sp. SUR17]